MLVERKENVHCFEEILVEISSYQAFALFQF